MNKIFLVLFAAVVSGTSAHAGSISFDGRADMLSNDFDDKSSTGADNVQFKLDTVRLDAKGKLNDSVSYRLRPRFTKNRTVSSRDAVGADLDLAYITNKFNDSLSLTLGKFATDMGGIEGNTSGTDLYLKTIANGTGHGIGDQYYTGAKIAYMIAGHEIAIHIANQAADAAGLANDGTGTATKFNQNKFASGLVFKGNLLDKQLSLIASYHTQDGKLSGPGTEDAKYKNTFMALGAKYDTDMFAVEGDYLMHTLGGYTVPYTATTAAKDDTLTTMQLGFAYKMDQWTPKIKFESTADTFASSTGADTKVTYTGMQLAIEYKPVKEENFRYHLAYLQREGKADTTGALAQTDKNIILGTRIMADFLK